MTTQDNLTKLLLENHRRTGNILLLRTKQSKKGIAGGEAISRAADAETVHAKNHLRVMGGVGKTPDNLKSAIHG